MIETPQIIQTTARLTAFIPLKVPISEIKNVMGPTIGEVYSTISAQGIAPAGPWFTHHLHRPTDVFDFEVSVPVASPVETRGRVKPGEWPAMKMARTVHDGRYEGLAEAWGEFHAWIAGQGLKVGAGLWEVYLVGPETSANPADWRTELNLPVID
ncbi:MAG: GyrI-like domain-containing protein [Candidatus Sumerlaeaceae bacterium]|nr:GyrI-like domain-containing protein [Candidatus Sumerlaeaceae bacterium]